MGKCIILIGFMASGKSTLGKKLANKLNIPFVDSDQKIEELTGKNIEAIFHEKGEEVFRQLEKEFIKSFPFPESCILSTGGGMPCFNDNIDLLKKKGVVFYLQRPAKEIVNRLLNAKEKRPLVEGKTEAQLLEYIETTLKEREEFYLQAHHVLEREEQTVDEIIELMEK